MAQIPKPSVAMTISFSLLWNLKRLLLLAIDDFKAENVMVQGQNWATNHGLAAYILAATSIEAFVNEIFFGMAPLLGPQYRVPEFGLEKDLERLELRAKVMLLPVLASMKPLDRGAAPYQDLDTLVKIRNDLVHYKMPGGAPGYVTVLQQRGIALSYAPGSVFAWPDAISTIEGIRWAHNTACAVIAAIAEQVPALRGEAEIHYSPFIKPLPATWITEQLRARRGIELP